jgi:hypothetical protein
MPATPTAFGAHDLLGEEGHLNIICVSRTVDETFVPTGRVEAGSDQALDAQVAHVA